MRSKDLSMTYLTPLAGTAKSGGTTFAPPLADEASVQRNFPPLTAIAVARNQSAVRELREDFDR